MTDAPLLPPTLRRIAESLDGIEHDHGVRILLAVESGSRAWGFPSPDSDYDVRFLYVRPLDWYLSLQTRRDVIELPIVDDLDINGWDIAKALALLAKSNPVLFEWLASPIIYRANPAALDALQAFADRVEHHTAALHHYRRLAEGNMRQHIAGRDSVRLKKYFYALRPACALAWLRTHPGERVPMALSELLAGIPLPHTVRASIAPLLAAKAALSEMGEGPRLEALDAFIDAEIATAAAGAPLDSRQDAVAEEADRLFRHLVLGGGEGYRPL